uniref:C2H2-type domain-containing protein n=1 Tax=Heterorhabditis bacteriophora TaxID=37862 RepID=A0A1I7XT62_HETBA
MSANRGFLQRKSDLLSHKFLLFSLGHCENLKLYSTSEGDFEDKDFGEDMTMKMRKKRKISSVIMRKRNCIVCVGFKCNTSVVVNYMHNMVAHARVHSEFLRFIVLNSPDIVFAVSVLVVYYLLFDFYRYRCMCCSSRFRHVRSVRHHLLSLHQNKPATSYEDLMNADEKLRLEELACECFPDDTARLCSNDGLGIVSFSSESEGTHRFSPRTIRSL